MLRMQKTHIVKNANKYENCDCYLECEKIMKKLIHFLIYSWLSIKNGEKSL